MSNSPLVVYTKLSPNRTKPRNHIIDTISIHVLDGDLPVESILNLSMFQNYDPVNGASCNYAIDSAGRIGLGVEEANRSWCTSSKSNDHRAITIEVANYKGGPNYEVTDKALEALVNLLTDVCKRNGIKQLLWKNDKSLVGQVDKQNMTVHRWFKNKACPGNYLLGKHTWIATEVNRRLNEEDKKVQKTLDNTPDPYAKDAVNWALDLGILKGDEVGDLKLHQSVTRQDVLVFMKRLHENKQKR